MFIPATLIAYPTVYPRGTTIYKPDKCGYTIIPTSFGRESRRELVKDEGAYLIDMNGNVVKFWKGVYGAFSNKILPGGYIMGTTGITPGLPPGARHQLRRNNNLAQWDWDGNIVWKFDKAEKVKNGDKWIWSARQHHDYQREGNPVGYYVPGMDPLVDRGKTLLNSTKIVNRPDITDKPIIDTWAIEVTWDGKIVWEWLITDHWDELGLSEAAKNAKYRNPGAGLLFNNINYLGPNKWYDAGDERFHPDNIISDIRGLNISLIISKKTGKIVWRLGPYFTDTPALRKIGQIISQHHVHMIPKGLLGAGNILIFDNGGRAGYGSPNPTAPKGVNNARRHYSRILEINPVTLEIVWQYRGRPSFKFFSQAASGMQRLPNGNTLITESLTARVFEVTPGKEIVWEYIRPNEGDGVCPVFRAYRIPYDWIPQLKKKPIEKAVIPPEPPKFIIKTTAQASKSPEN
ncbi:MAG: arylsulfotransferase family protein [Planctomycetota bacterium]